MVDLIAKSPCHGVLPVEVGGISLTEEPQTHVTMISATRAREAQMSELLKTAHGMSFPKPNRATGKAGARAIWFAQGQALLIGPAPSWSLVNEGTLVDQSDGWVIVRLEGEGAEDVLARLVPIDLRTGHFKRGHTVRTMLQHMSVSVTRVGDHAFQIMGFRSMAKTLVHDLHRAMESCAARG